MLGRTTAKHVERLTSLCYSSANDEPGTRGTAGPVFVRAESSCARGHPSGSRSAVLLIAYRVRECQYVDGAVVLGQRGFGEVLPC